MPLYIIATFLTLSVLVPTNIAWERALPPCVDEAACPYIQQGNQDACSNPTLNVYCKKTCGLCSTHAPSPGYQGPLCFNCINQVDQPSHCVNKQVCGRDEFCGVIKLTNGLYEVKCMSNQSCQAPGPNVACVSCCSSDLCNQNCRLPSECLDNDLCPVLERTVPTLCTIPDLAVQCNGTCIKQKNETCNGIAGSSITLASGTSTSILLTSSTKSLMPAQTTTPSANNGNDPCLLQPCVHGQCHPHSSSTSVSYTCTCDLGYIGALCGHPDPCYRQPCVHGQCTAKDSVGGYQCDCDQGFSGLNCDVSLVRDCQDVLDNHIPSSAGDNIYVLDINGNILGSRKLNVKCDMDNDKGWIVLMERDSGRLNFDDKYSTEYAVGFGNIRDEFWIGLEYMHALTSDGRRYQLRIDLTTADGSKHHEIYNDFNVGPHSKFELNIGSHYGSAGDSLSGHSKFGFTTKDHDQDSNTRQNCAAYISGGWWFHDCADSCLTCNYVTPGTYDCRSMSWKDLGYCIALKGASMKMRPM